MKFSTVAASVALFGAVAIAAPGETVYQTAMVTITSCAPDVEDCPGRASATPVPSVSKSVPAVVPSAPAVPSVDTTKLPPYPSVPVGTGVPKPPKGSDVPSVPKPPMGTGIPSKPSGTGSYNPPKNTSVPATPSVPSYETGAASTNAFSVVAIIAAAGALFLA